MRRGSDVRKKTGFAATNKLPGKRALVFLMLLTIAVVIILSYSNSLRGPFLMDGRRLIENDPRIRHLLPLGKLLSGSSRPVTRFSFALNYSFNKLDVFGYHAVNLTIHLLSALLLFGLIRRTLSATRMRPGYASSAAVIAFTATLLWAIHPIQTQSVTYIYQRSESLMGLFYLATLYAITRGLGASGRAAGWFCAACVFCGLGMGAKPVMITAPLMALAYDRIFWADSFKELWQRRRWLYVGLASTWLILAIVFSGPQESRPTAGWTFKYATPLAYAAIQPTAILRYLRLVFWPYGLVFDYAWPAPLNAVRTILPLLMIAGLLIATLWALFRRPQIGFLGSAFFLLLLPTSSFFQIADPIVEHRMYLPLAIIMIGIILAARHLLRTYIRNPQWRARLAAGTFTVLVAFLCMRTFQRNDVYQSRYSVWQDVVNKRPGNPRGHANLANILAKRGKLDEAIAHYSLALKGDKGVVLVGKSSAKLHYDLALALSQNDDLDGAIAHYQEALCIDPRFVDARNNLALTLADRDRFQEAMAELLEALELAPDNPVLHLNLGTVLESLGNLQEAIGQYRKAIALDPANAEARNNLGIALAQRGEIAEAVRQLERAHQLLPGDAEIRQNLAEIRQQLKK